MPSKNKEVLSLSQRVGELFVVPFMLLMFGFFLYHQVADTGFFTDKFGFLEKVALYGPLFLGMTAPFVRAVTGHRNPARPFEAFTSLCLAVGTYWLLKVFPLDYTHLTDALPGFLRFSLSWVTDGIAKAVFVFIIVVSSISAFVVAVQYLTFPRSAKHAPS